MTAESKKTLGFLDLLLYGGSVAISIRWISTAAGAGPASLPIWVAAILLFGGPLILATAVLTGRFDHEGGVYAWTGETFGPFWGFLCGWLYWMSNLPFFSGMLIFMLNLLLVALGPAGQPFLTHSWMFTTLAVAVSIAVGAAHYFGMGSGKWLSNIGSGSNVVLFGLLVLVAAGVAQTHGSATDFVHADYRPPLGANGAILWATMMFAAGGPESLAFLRNDVRGGMPTVLKVLALVMVAQIVFYMVSTSALLVILPASAATHLSGLPDALVAGLKALGLEAVAPVVLIGGFLGSLGSYSAWFGIGARLPFAAGLDAFLPAAFARRDPRTGAPVVSIVVQTVIVAVIVVISQAGNTFAGAYDFIVSMSVLSYALPFLFLFAVFLALRKTPVAAGVWTMPGGAAAVVVVGVSGFAATLLAIGCSLVPSPDAKDPAWEMVKLLVASAVLIGAGVAFYAVARRRARRA
jgi:amino acid transporter